MAWLGCLLKRKELNQPLWLIRIACKPRRNRSGPEQGEFLLIATNLLDVPAEVIALICRRRWTVELFRFYFMGWADLDELETHIAKLQNAEI